MLERFRVAVPFVVAAIASLVVAGAGPAKGEVGQSVQIVAFGNSLIAGPGLDSNDTFSRQLERALRQRGHDVRIIDAGVSGDTTAGGLARLDWSIPADADAVIYELGANDAFRLIPPPVIRQNLEAALTTLGNRGLPVLLAGMRAPRNLGEAYTQAFDAIYPSLSKQLNAILYPFFLKDVATIASLNLADGIHPNAQGVAVMVRNILPYVERLLSAVNAKKR